MNDGDALKHIFERVEALVAAGKDGEAKKFLVENLEQLPEDTQADVMLAMYTDALEKQVSALETTRTAQEMVVALAKAIQGKGKADS